MKRTQKTLASVSSNRYPSVFFFLNSSSSVFFITVCPKTQRVKVTKTFFSFQNSDFQIKKEEKQKKSISTKKKETKTQKNSGKISFFYKSRQLKLRIATTALDCIFITKKK